MYESKNFDIHNNTIIESRNVSVFEHVFSCKSKGDDSSSSKRTFNQKQGNETKDMKEKPRQSKRARTEKSLGLDFLTYMLEAEP